MSGPIAQTLEETIDAFVGEAARQGRPVPQPLQQIFHAVYFIGVHAGMDFMRDSLMGDVTLDNAKDYIDDLKLVEQSVKDLQDRAAEIRKETANAH